MFIAREKEKELLKRKLTSGKKASILLYGRRRIGKTSLVREVLEEIPDAVIISHEFHKVALEINLEEFSNSVGLAFGIRSMPAFRTIVDAFTFIAAQNRRTIVVLDEYSDLKEGAPNGAVDSYLRTCIDTLSENISLIVLGSTLKLMGELLEEDNPLFGRFTTVLRLRPFDYFDSGRFFPDLSFHDRMLMYCVFGGSPYVLSLLDGSRSMEDNLIETMISPDGPLKNYTEAVINLEAGRVPHGVTILTLLGNGKKRYSELESFIGKSATGVLSKELQRLVELELIEKVEPINKPARSKCFYRIQDPLVRFHFAYASLRSGMMLNPELSYANLVKPSLHEFIARSFEDACREYFVRLIARGLRNDILAVGTYWYDNPKTRTNGEFDVALKTSGGFEVYDAKFVSKAFSAGAVEKERQQISSIPLPLMRWGIISSAGFENQDDSLVQLTLDNLFSETLA